MPAALRPGLVLALALAAFGLAGCLTPRAKVHVSQAVLDARAHHDVTQVATCPQTPLATASPAQLSFAFDSAEMDATSTPLLAAAAQWIACHRTAVAILPDSDRHGTASEQDRLARQRAETVAAFLTAHRVDPSRIRILPRGQPAPRGEIFLIHAEGRRW